MNAHSIRLIGFKTPNYIHVTSDYNVTYSVRQCKDKHVYIEHYCFYNHLKNYCSVKSYYKKKTVESFWPLNEGVGSFLLNRKKDRVYLNICCL